MDSRRGHAERESRHIPKVRLTRLNRGLLCFLGFIIALIPFAVSSSNGVIDPFTHGFVSTTILALRSGSLQFANAVGQNIPGTPLFMAQAALLTGINPLILEYLPLAGIGGFVAAFFLGLQLLRNAVVAVFVADILSIQFFGTWLYSVWPHAFGYLLFLFFLGVFGLRGPRTPAKVVLLWVIFMAIQVYSYSAELCALSFVIFIQAYALVARRNGSLGRAQHAPLPLSAAISGAMIVTFFGLNQVFYGQYLPKLIASQGDLSTSLSYYFASLLRASPPVPYAWIPPRSSFAQLVVHIASLVLAFAPFMLAFPPFRKRASPSPEEASNQFGLLAGGLTFAWIVDVAAYTPIGGFGATILFVPSLVVPFLALMLVGRLRGPNETRIFDRGRVLAVYAAALVLVSAATFGLALGSGTAVSSASHYEHLDNSALWLYSKAPWVTAIFSDHNTQGRYSIVYATYGKFFDPNHLYTSDSFSHLVDPIYTARTDSYFLNDYVTVNLELDHGRTLAGGFLDFEPLAPHVPTIESNVNLGLIYADGYSDIFLGMSS